MSATGVDVTGPAESVAVLGERVSLPVEVRSAAMVGATFSVPATRAQELIEYSGLRVARVGGMLGLCTLGAVHYTDNDLGPYNEVALAVVVEPHDGSPAGSMASGNLTTFIHRLPVNQEFTCAAGRDIWGFPKWVCDITWRRRGRRTDVVLVDGDELILALGVTHSPLPMPANEMEMQCYSWRDGVLRLTPWTMRLNRVHMRPGGAEVELGANHEMADELRRLGFPKPALLSQTVGHLSCTFGAAQVVNPATTAP